MASTSVGSFPPNQPLPTKRHKIAELQTSLKDILSSTSWPKDAAPEVERFSQSSNVSIDVEAIPENESDIPGPLMSALDSTIRDLEDARKEIETASDTLSGNRKSVRKKVKKLFSRNCTEVEILGKCRAKIEASLRNLKTELAKLDDSAVSPSANPVPPTTQSTTLNPLDQPSEATSSSDGSWREKIIGPAKMIFKGAEAVSGAIPLAGSYIGGVAKFGLTCIEMVEAMDQNNETIRSLGSHIDALSKTLKEVKKPGLGEQNQTIQAVNALYSRLEPLRNEIERMQSGTTMSQFWNAEKDAGTLKRLQDQVRVALEEIKLLTSLNTSLLVDELLDAARSAKNRDLLRTLGDGKYGVRGNVDEEIRCFPGTRVKVLERVDTWMRSRDPADRVLWIRGMAGRGKSTIASTVHAIWKQRAVCALFHFRRGEIPQNETPLIRTIAQQLARGVDAELRARILGSVEAEEDIVNNVLSAQFKALVVDTLAVVGEKPYPILIVVDALDECDTPNYAVNFIQQLKMHMDAFPPNVKILLTSRPELPLLRELQPADWQTEDLESNQEDVELDIQRYLRHDLVKIRKSQSLPTTWPSEEVVLQLAQMSQGLFQWTRTLTMLIRKGHAISRVEEVLRSPGKWKGVDELYRQILSKAVDNLGESTIKEDLFLPVLETILAAAQPMSLNQIAFIHSDAFASIQDAPSIIRDEVLADLNSLLLIPTTPTEPVLLMHTSIRDLLLNRNRCKNASYWVDLPAVHRRLATTCIQKMDQHLRQDIAKLRSISQPVSEMENIAQQSVSHGLQYCCRSWSIHLANGWTGSDSPVERWTDLVCALRRFSETKALFWLEVMSLMGWLGEAIAVAKQAESWFSVTPNQISDGGALGVLWNDMHRFINAFWEPIAFNPMQIYISALAHCPQRTAIWERYRDLAKVIALPATPSRGWPSEQWARLVGCVVLAISYSPDGSTIAAGGEDGMIRLLDAQTGAQVGEPLTGHGGQVRSVSFSPDGKLLASGSVDRTVRLWDTQTGKQVGAPLTGHFHWVNSVSFSPDGKLLASASNDGTVRPWNAQTGGQMGESLMGHGDRVSSVSFSPDGKLLASGSVDRTVRLWDTQTGKQVGAPLTGHDYWVNSVSFSPNGKLLASGSGDGTVQLWDSQTGEQVGAPLTGHFHWVNSVSFSPDGKLLASASNDGTVRLWDAQTGAQVGEPLTGHIYEVSSVIFSPDGKLVASGSRDKTVRLWNAQTGEQVGEPLRDDTPRDDTDYPNSIAFSISGDVITATYSLGPDCSWDVNTRQKVSRPSDLPSSVDFPLRDRWLSVGSSRIFWFAAKYWTGYAQFHRASGMVVVYWGSNLAFFNISRALDPFSLP